MENAKTSGKTIKVALLRGNFLNEWDGKLWENLAPNIETTGFCSFKNAFNTQGLGFKVNKIFSSSDNFILKNLLKYGRGCYRKMYGLENKLKDFDIAHSFELYNYFTTQAVAAKKRNKKLKVVAHFADNTFGRFEYNYWPGFKSPPAYWRNRINKIIRDNIKGVDLFLPITKNSEELLLAYGAPREKIKVLTYGINPAPQSSGTMAHPELPDLDSGDIFLMVNRITKEKGVYEALYGWQLFVKAKPELKRHLIIIGDGPERFNLMRIAGELKLNDSVTFIKNLPNSEVKKLYLKAKGLILDSLPTSVWQEQFGFVLAEAITAGCPVISTYSGAIPEVVEDAGLLISPGHPLELRDALLKLDDPLLVKNLKENGSRIKNKFSVENFKKQLAEIYNNLAQQ